MQEFIKIDPHVHSKGISLCSHVSCQEIVDEKQRLGYEGAVLTNHCQRWYYPAEQHGAFIERVIEEFHQGKKYADEKGFRFYLGLEVSLDDPHYADWLLYGTTEAFLRSSPCLYQLTQKQLFALCEEWGVVLVQAHPFRQSPCDPNYMHGVERNCSIGDLDKTERVEAFAKEHDLLVTVGTDYHGKDNLYRGGIYVPKTCTDSTDIAGYLRRGKVRVFAEGEETEYESGVFHKK